MIILISGASHAGKTALAQKLLEKYKAEKNIVIFKNREEADAFLNGETHYEFKG